MDIQPFKNHAEGAGWHLTFDNAILDADIDFVVTIPCMEMSWSAIGKIHQNDYSVEEADLRHKC